MLKQLRTAMSGFLLLFLLVGCGGDGSTPVTPIITTPTYTKALLKMNLSGIPAGKLVGALQVSFVLPTGASLVKDASTGDYPVVLSGVAKGSLSAPNYDPTTRLVSAGIINSSGFGNGEVLTITATIASGSVLTAQDFQSAVTIISIKDSDVQSISGATCMLSATLQ